MKSSPLLESKKLLDERPKTQNDLFPHSPDCFCIRCREGLGFAYTQNTSTYKSSDPDVPAWSDYWGINWSEQAELTAAEEQVLQQVRAITAEIKRAVAQKGSKKVKPMAKERFKKLPFLKPEHLNQKGTTPMKITGVGYIGDSGFGLKINFNVEVKGKQYSFGVKPTNRAIRTVIEGAIARKPVPVEVGEYNGNDFVQVVE